MTDDSFSEKLFDQIFDQFVLPEVERRREGSVLLGPIELNRIQVVFYPDRRPTAVRLNEEIQGIPTLTFREGFTPKEGEVVTFNDIESIKNFELDEKKDPDCGHVTMIKLASGWRIIFDFRYNRTLAGKHLISANEFLAAARESLSKNRLSPLVDNLYSACELSAKAALLAFPDPKFREKTTHNAIKSRFNRAAQVGNASREHAGALNRLSKLRGSARYLKNELALTEMESADILHVVEDLIESTGEFFEKGTA